MLEPFGNFSIKSATSIFLHPAIPSLSYCIILDSLMPNKFSIFMWKLTNSFFPVDSLIQTVGFHMASQCHCKQGEDAINHIFLIQC